MRAKIDIKGFDEYFEQLKKLGGDVETAGVECVEAGVDILYQEMHKRIARHKDSGAELASLVKEPVKNYSGYIHGFAGTVKDRNPEGFMRSVYQEFGSPTFSKDPWLRPAEQAAKRKYTKRCEEILKKHGVDCT